MTLARSATSAAFMKQKKKSCYVMGSLANRMPKSAVFTFFGNIRCARSLSYTTPLLNCQFKLKNTLHDLKNNCRNFLRPTGGSIKDSDNWARRLGMFEVNTLWTFYTIFLSFIRYFRALVRAGRVSAICNRM